MLNRQEVFNTVYTKLREQGKRSVDAVGQCMYRAPNGNKCAIGHLIPEALYKPSMEGSGVSNYASDVVSNILEQVFGKLTSEDFKFFILLQKAHDNWNEHDTTSFDTSMRMVADLFNLEFNDA